MGRSIEDYFELFCQLARGLSLACNWRFATGLALEALLFVCNSLVFCLQLSMWYFQYLEIEADRLAARRRIRMLRLDCFTSSEIWFSDLIL